MAGSTVPDPAHDLQADERRADLVFAAVVVAWLAGTAILYWLFPQIIALLLFSALISYAVLPLVDRLARRMPRTVAILALSLGGVGLLVLGAVLLAPVVAAQVAQAPEVLARALQSLSRFWQELHERLPAVISRPADRMIAAFARGLRRDSIEPGNVTDWATSVATGAAAVASALVFVPLFVFLMMRGYHQFVQQVSSAVPPRWRKRFFERTHQADAVLSGFIRGQLLVAVILAVTYGVAFTVVGIPLGLVIGILAGLGEIVPFLGGVIAVTMGSLMALVGGQFSDFFWVVGIYFVVQALQGALLSPIIIGQGAKLGPVGVVVALAVGGQAFGFIGLLLAVPVAGLLKVALRAAMDAYRATPFFRRHAEA